MTTNDSKIETQSGADDQGVRFRRTHEKVKVWNYATDRIQDLLRKVRFEISNSIVADDFDPEVVHDLRKIHSQMNRLKQEIRSIEVSIQETLVVEREWWKK